MVISAQLLGRIFDSALEEFLDRESDSVLAGVSERNSCARLGQFLERAAGEAGLTAYVADVEYNRKQSGAIKTILDDEPKVVQVTCDLILHSRGESVEDDNLIAIEMKKSNRPQREKDSDRSRLRAMTKRSYDDVWSNDGVTHPEHVCGYRMGVYVEVDVIAMKARLEYFADGVFERAEERDLRLRAS